MAETLQPLADNPAAVRPGRWLRRVPALTLGLFLLPIAAGLIGTWLPAFGLKPSIKNCAPKVQTEAYKPDQPLNAGSAVKVNPAPRTG